MIRTTIKLQEEQKSNSVGQSNSNATTAACSNNFSYFKQCKKDNVSNLNELRSDKELAFDFKQVPFRTLTPTAGGFEQHRLPFNDLFKLSDDD